MKSKLLLTVMGCTMMLGVSACGSSHDEGSTGTIENAPSASATTAQAVSNESTSEETVVSSASASAEETEAVTRESEPAETETPAEKVKMLDHQDEAVEALEGYIATSLDDSNWRGATNTMGKYGVELDSSASQYFGKSSGSQVFVSILPEGERSTVTVDGSRVTVSMNVYQAHSVVNRSDSMSDAMKRLIKAANSKISEGAQPNTTVTATVQLSDDGSTGTLSVSEDSIKS